MLSLPDLFILLLTLWLEVGLNWHLFGQCPQLFQVFLKLCHNCQSLCKMLRPHTVPRRRLESGVISFVRIAAPVVQVQSYVDIERHKQHTVRGVGRVGWI